MSFFSKLYKYIFKPLAFRLDPEMVHNLMLKFGVFCGNSRIARSLVRRLFSFQSDMLEQELAALTFKNPVGLSAGFDKNAQLTSIIPAVGFGFMEVGSITAEPCRGNNKRRLWRLPKSQSICVNFGLNNYGADIISQRLKNTHCDIPLGINIGKTNSPLTTSLQEGANDYKITHQLFSEIGDYTTINISCPNTHGGEPFTEPKALDELLTVLDLVNTSKPLFVKLSPDLKKDQVLELLEVMNRHRVEGIICSNLTKDRHNLKIIDKDIPVVGGFSGKVVEELSNQLLALVYKESKGKYIIIGTGGVFTAEDAYKKIRLGASLVQLITGMIYQGPGVIKEINQGLVRLLQRDNFSHISEAIGVDNKF